MVVLGVEIVRVLRLEIIMLIVCLVREVHAQTSPMVPNLSHSHSHLCQVQVKTGLVFLLVYPN